MIGKGTLTAFLVLIFLNVNAQKLFEVKGRIISADDGEPAIGANIVIKESDPLVGVITDFEGYYSIKSDNPYIILIYSYVGYESEEVVIDLNLQRSPVEMDISLQPMLMEEVVIIASASPANDFATVSSRPLNIEETKLYSGGFNDIARVAQNFAGVQKKDDSSNEIVVRGNAPGTVLWRVEGIDIPNPNHFSEFGTSGGNLSVLNTNTMAGAGFYTGAFPANYGNALGAAFDIKLRKGNNEKWQGMTHLGFNGFEVMGEGPVGTKGGALMVNYRNSNLVLLDKIGVIDFDVYLGVPSFNDFTFKLDFPESKYGSFSLFGIGGFSDVTTSASKIIKKENTSEQAKREAIDEGLDINYGSKLGVTGISHHFNLSSDSYLKSSIAFTTANSYALRDTLDLKYSPHRQYEQDFRESKIKFMTTYGHFLNENNQIQATLNYDRIFFGLDRSMVFAPGTPLVNFQSDQGSTGHQQASIIWKYTSPSERLEINTGIAEQFLSWNKTYAIEPRISLKYELSEANTLSAAAGKHSQLLPITEYFRKDPDSETAYPNRNLELMKSNHYVLAHTWQVNEYISWSQEVYYQDLYDIPVSGDIGNSWSIINRGIYEDGDNQTGIWANNGSGRNYGLDMTIKLNDYKGYYALLTGSVFSSEYAGSDEIWRSSAWDSRFMVNSVLGKSIEFGNHKLNFNISQNWTGGQKYAPIMVEESIRQKQTVRDFENDFTAKYADYYKLDFRIGWEVPFGKTVHELALDLQNVTNRKNILYQSYSPALQDIKTVYQLGFIPVFEYQIRF